MKLILLSQTQRITKFPFSETEVVSPTITFTPSSSGIGGGTNKWYRILLV